MNSSIRLIFSAAVLAIAACTAPANAMVSDDSCLAYRQAVEIGSGIAIPVVPDRLLTNWQDALPCLVKIIGSVKSDVKEGKFTSEAQSKFLSATGALRTIITRLNAADAKSDTKTLIEFIGKFRTLPKTDEFDAVVVLTYGARSDKAEIRLNSVVILGNVIDNQFVCIPLTHLNDPGLPSTDYGINGRANLLSITSVVAPWAYYEHFETIKATREAINNAIPKTDSSLEQTRLILDNIKIRLDAQKPNSNKGENLPPQWRADCKKYVDDYVPKLSDKSRLKY